MRVETPGDGDFEVSAQGCVLPVWAQPGASRDAIRGWQDGALRVAVTQAPEKGKANQALREVIARGLSLKKSQVMLLRGATGRRKRFLIVGLSARELAERIEAACRGPG